ncbi:M24B family metallopeptidase [Candidatus Kinetoplastidibacterium blastocrithidiae]|uniref:M24B family metallopeptidase n=1 Tax=Candidatus Kinetoplastidibacterium blastocrithidiae TaxID=233181 RepID=UPI0002A66AD2|nr:M24B family metallopeptidase [Candidatus Kinetoplastibacterium blastocrithidii]AFZ83838.1 hypothetical protein CKBE_00648 [Candidatus Kinetoplastibacterium blastocrithidii (ex Strigomonas culicis)]
MYEYELEAKLLYEFNKHGAKEVSCKSIIASGSNSCTLHYSRNNSIIKNGDLVLIDACCELDNYASDITRTFPANGKFSSPQLALYEIVLEAQKSAIDKTIAGNNFIQPHETAVKIIVQGLIDEKILNGTVEEIIENETYKYIFPHNTSHWIGIDVHDVGNYYKLNDGRRIWLTLVSGMLLTIEPGIYIRPSHNIPSIFWNIGIRIEDTLLINEKGNEIISKNAPVDPSTIENIMHL